MSRTFSLIGAGPGQPGFLTARARKAIASADEAYAAGRTAGALASLRKEWKLCPAEDAAEIAAESKKKHVAVLLNGDTGFFSEVERMREVLAPHGEVEVYPGVSSVQYLCAQIGESWDTVFWMKPGACDLLAAVSYHSKVCLVLERTQSPAAVCAELCAAGLGKMRVVIGTRLGTGREHIEDQTAQLLRSKKFGALAVMLLLQDNPAVPLRPVLDTDLVGADDHFPQEMRWNAINLLDVQPDDTVYVVGAGNGAMAIELARRAHEGRVYALEENEEQMSLLARNRETLGGWNVRAAHGKIAAAMQPLTAPDAAFVDANAGELRGILAALREKNPHVRVVLAADTLERLSESQLVLAGLRYRNVTVSQLLLSHGRVDEAQTVMQGGQTLFLLRAGK